MVEVRWSPQAADDLAFFDANRLNGGSIVCVWLVGRALKVSNSSSNRIARLAA
jgi:hypothetical protein